MTIDPEHIAAIATALILDHAREATPGEIQAVIGEQFTGLDHVDRAILADQITEAIQTASVTVDIAGALVRHGEHATA